MRQLLAALLVGVLFPCAVLAQNGIGGVGVGPAPGVLLDGSNIPSPSTFRYNLGVGTGTPARGYIRGEMPWAFGDAAISPAYYYAAGTAGGHAAVLTVEAPDDFDAVEIGFFNGSSSPISVGQAVVAPTASYNSNYWPGVDVIDATGTRQTGSMWPVTFNNGGRQTTSQFWPGPLSNFTGVSTTSGNQVVSVPLGSASSNVLSVASTISAAMQGAFQIVTGEYASDTQGCIPANTTITAVSPTTLTLSASVGTCTPGQLIFVTFAPINAFGISIPPGTASMPSIVWSDPIPVNSLSRIDGGMAAGDAVSGTNVPGGATVLSVAYNGVTISSGMSGAGTLGEAITFTRTPTASAAVLAGDWKIPLSSVVGVNKGDFIAAGSVVPAGTSILAVYGGYAWLSQETTGPISAGATITITKVANLSAAVSSGATFLPFESTNTSPLLTIRTFMGATGAWVHEPPFGGPANLLGSFGVRNSVSYFGTENGSSIATDILNFPGNASNTTGIQNSGAANPVFGFRFLSRHRGITVLSCGDSHFEGDSTYTGNMNWVRLASAMASTPGIPVSYVNAARGGTRAQIHYPLCMQYVQAFQPELVLLQALSGNIASNSVGLPGPFLSMVASIAQYVQSYGDRVIYASDYPRAAVQIGALPVNGAVASSTTVPLLMTIPSGVAVGVPLLVTAQSGASVPPGTTTTFASSSAAQTNGITTSNPITASAGAILSLGELIAGSGSAGTAVTFTTACPLAITTATLTQNGNPVSPTLTCSVGSTAGTLSAALTVNAGDVFVLGSSSDASAVRLPADAYIRTLLGSSQIVTTAPETLFDPNNPGFFLPGYSLDGLHTTDYGHAAIANAFLPTLQQALGN